MSRVRYAIFVHEPDGDMGFGAIVGPFYDQRRAVAKGNAIETRASKSPYLPRVECVVLPVLPGGTSVTAVMEEVTR